MTTPRKLIGHITAEPFRFFRINIASDQRFEIRHPEYIAVSRNSDRVFMPEDDSGCNATDRWHDLSLMLIESIESDNTPLAQDPN